MTELLSAHTLDGIVKEALELDPDTSVVDLVVEYAEKRGMEFESIAHVASGWLREKLRADFMSRRMLEKQNVLPFES